ncbi:hypothetical protein [Lactiplantibacillus plantarum]|uniref:hypothetical protein n=1 Tax=Lactiplantibacillus plantarum TaxID=1590 RepID=UPI000978C6BF|nr:hypothetical protein [Lactiplantibacillus plantarum]
MQELLQGIVLSGVLGYLQISLLQDVGKVSKLTPKEDKAKVALLLSVLDYLIYLVFIDSLKLSIIVSALSTVTLAVLLAFLIGHFYKIYVKLINKHFNKGANLSLLSPREGAFDYGGLIFIYAFTFDHQLITEGYVERCSMLDGDMSLSIHPKIGLVDSKTPENKIIDLINNEYYKLPTAIYIDATNKIKYYIIYPSSDEWVPM